MRVAWVEVHIPPTDVLESYMDSFDGTPFPSTRYEGEVISAIRAWGETKLVVMLDSGGVREVNVSLVQRSSPTA